MATAKKISKQTYKIDYDATADVLYVSFGKPKPAICVEVNEGDLIRVDAYSDKIVGITVVDFKKRYMVRTSQLSIEETARNLVPEILTQCKH